MNIAQRYRNLEDWVIKDVARTDRNHAVELLVYKYREAVILRALRILSSNQDAYEICQEVFIRAFLDQGIFDPERKLRSWLLAVTRNLSLNWRRDNRKHEEKSPVSNLYATSDGPYDGYQKRQRAEIVNVAVSKLNDRYQNVIHYFYYQDLTCSEIAEIMGTSESNVRKIMHRARGNLKELIEPHLR